MEAWFKLFLLCLVGHFRSVSTIMIHHTTDDTNDTNISNDQDH